MTKTKNSIAERQAKLKATQEIIEKYVNGWTQKLGLRYWECSFHYISEPENFPAYFANDERGKDILAHCDSDWRYQQLLVAFNLPALSQCDEEKIERVVVHELVHALVNEMRARGVAHEERVVTQLTKAFIWTRLG